MGAWNDDIHSFTSNWREMLTIVETLKREEVIFNKLRGKMVFYFTDNEVTYNICKKGSSKTLSLYFSPTTKSSRTRTGVSPGSHPCPRDHYDHTGPMV
jgi:hypothetical protein